MIDVVAINTAYLASIVDTRLGNGVSVCAGFLFGISATLSQTSRDGVTLIDHCRFTIFVGTIVITRFALFFGLLLTGFFHQTVAASENVYAVENVAVDQTAETAAAARDIALAGGQQGALQRLLRRLTLSADHQRLPNVASAKIAELVKGIEVSEEKTSPTRYIATLRVTFKKEQVRRLLREQDISFSETRAKPLLLLPVFRAAGAVRLWQNPNPWRDAWSNVTVSSDSPVPFVVPAGELADVAAISADQALAGDRRRLEVLADRYGVDDALVAFAEVDVDLATRARSLQVSLRQHGPTGPNLIVESFSSVGQETEAALIGRAVARIAAGIQERWKEDTLIRFDRERSLSVSVPLSGLRDWIVVRERLAGNSLVQRVDLTSLSVKSAQVVVHYWGDIERLTIALAQSNLRLTEDATGFWSVVRFDGS